MSDYIRRDDAKDALQEKVFHNLTDEFYGAMQVFDELEPADVAPVVHGEYIGEYDGYADGYPVCDMWYCSVCGCHFEDWDEKPTYNYCPNCGAKMDKE